MKKLLFTSIAIICVVFSSFAQANFKWEKIDSVAKTKAQIYSDTKMFISEYWKSAKDVIQNDDKDGGIILIKGLSIQKFNYSMADYVYTYKYDVSIKIKERKYKITIDNVKCESVTLGGKLYPSLKVEPFEGENTPDEVGKGKYGQKVILMMSSLKDELQSIVENYEKQIKKASQTNGDW